MGAAAIVQDAGTIARFWQKVKIAPGCWEWQGYRRKGYGLIAAPRPLGGQLMAAHRLSWTMQYGPIAQGAYVLHRCDNPPCVRPSHLFIGDQTSNQADAKRKGRHRLSSLTHCQRGHSFGPGGDWYRTKSGQRRCRVCMRTYSRASKARRKLRALEPEEPK